MIEQFAAIASEIARAPDDESLRQIVDDAALRIFGEGHFTLGASRPGTAGAVPILCNDRPDEYLHAEGLDGHSAAPLLLQAMADLLGARLTAIMQLSRSTGMQRRLTMDRAYFEQLFAASPEAIVVLDSQDRIVRLNRAFEQLFGYAESEAEGRTINYLIVPPESREQAMALTDRVARGEVIREEAVRSRKDGSPVHVMILATPIVVQGDQVAVYGIYRDITQQKETEEALRRLSTTDELTGLYNRRGFFLVAEQQRKVAMRKKAELLLLFIDIDDFKHVNDAYGHLEGDQVLADLGQLLRRCYRDSDILARVSETEDVVARMGGDEFVVLAIDPGDEGERILVTRLRETLAIYNEERRAPYRVSLSVGAVRVAPDPGNTVDEILAAADRLMYQDKRGLMRL
jgi:diguanylate cyclase (GGDEF)-like protein/PAS domain S-box-containing protein